MTDQAPKTPDPPSGWSATDFDSLIAAIAAKVNVPVKASTKMVTPWRWTAGINPFDGAGKGVRDNLAALVTFVNRIKVQADTSTAAVADLDARVTRLEEAPAPRPFP